MVKVHIIGEIEQKILKKIQYPSKTYHFFSNHLYLSNLNFSEITEGTGQAAPVPKDWSQQVDEAEKQMTEKQMTLDEYKRQLGEKKKAHLEKLPQFNTRTAGEGEDPATWKKAEHVYRKKNDDGESEEGESGAEGLCETKVFH
jgi:hypothetical protein